MHAASDSRLAQTHQGMTNFGVGMGSGAELKDPRVISSFARRRLTLFEVGERLVLEHRPSDEWQPMGFLAGYGHAKRQARS
jgi:hypothetical protein